jgi:hypothetical protein
MDEDGMLVVRGRLEPETGAIFLRALEAASDRLYEQHRQAQDRPSDDAPIEHRRADAMGLIAESALAANLDPGTRADRYQVVVHVDASVLEEPAPDETGQPGMAVLEDAVDVSAEASRRLACDCATVTMTHDSVGNILDVGRRTRTISPAMRRALTFRDRTCRFPGCAVTVCDGHHVKHWADGGETKLDNLLFLCRRHHVAVHEEGYRVEVQADGQARFFHPQGWEIKQAPQPPDIVDHSQSVLAPRLLAAGVEVGSWTGSATCYSGPVDYGLALEGMMEERCELAGSSQLMECGASVRRTDTLPRERHADWHPTEPSTLPRERQADWHPTVPSTLPRERRDPVQREPSTNGPAAPSRADRPSPRSRCPP